MMAYVCGIKKTDLKAYICLGSNAENARHMLHLACENIANFPDMHLCAQSPVYRTEPQGYADQPWFHNQILEVEPGSSWNPCSLVDALLIVETDLGRVRSSDPALRFGPRSIDADLLLFGQVRSTHAHCMVPHPRLTQRAFALIPLLDVAPHVRINGRPAIWWLQRLKYRREGDCIFQ